MGAGARLGAAGPKACSARAEEEDSRRRREHFVTFDVGKSFDVTVVI